MDLLSAMALILAGYGVTGYFIWFFAFYLLAKGVLFIKNLSSIVDIFSSLVIITAVYGWFSIVHWLIVLWLIQKGIFSLLS